VAGSGLQGATNRALGGNSSLEKLPKIAVFRVLKHGTERILVTTDSEQSHHVDVLQTSHRPRILVELGPTEQHHSKLITLSLAS